MKYFIADCNDQSASLFFLIRNISGSYFWRLTRFYFGSKGNFILKKRTKCLESCMHMLI